MSHNLLKHFEFNLFIKKSQYKYVSENRNKKAFIGFFAMEPWLFDLLVNVVLLFALTAIGFGIIYAINARQTRKYGEFCKTDNDCQANKNLVCQSGDDDD